MNIVPWVILGVIMLAVVAWAFRDVQIRMGSIVRSEAREDPWDELRRK